MLVLGVTGNIACGKSTVDELLAEIAGATVIDADRVTHALLRDDVGVRSAIVSAFGPTVMESDGSLNRSRLGRIVFSDRAQLRRLEAIVHPGVRHLVRTELAAMPPDATVVIDAVKLLDGDLGTLVDSIWWVTAPPEQQLERLIRGAVTAADRVAVTVDREVIERADAELAVRDRGLDLGEHGPG